MADAFLETTVWDKAPQTPNHTYLMDGDKALGYIKAGTKEEFYFTKPMQLDKRHRTFKKLSSNPFGCVNPFGLTEADPALIEVKGSKGESYYVDPAAKTCTCKGFVFRGTCKHLTAV